MGELQVTPWRRYGQARLYVKLPDGREVAWFNLRTQQLTVLLDVPRDEVLDALAPYLDQRPEPSTQPAAAPVTLSMVPTPPTPISPPAPAVGWVPDVTMVPAPKPERPAEPRSALAPRGAALHPADDLAVNLPGSALRAKVEEQTPGFWRALLNFLLRRPTETDGDGWRKGLIGEEMAGKELARLTTWGWRVLHSIPLPNNVDIDHLLIGPGGVFTINTKHHVGARVWVGDQAVKVNGQWVPYAPKARAEARRAAAVLSRACAFDVRVEPVLAFVAPERLTMAPPHADPHPIRLRAIRHSEIITFKDLPAAWQPAQTEQIYAAARDRQNWLGAGRLSAPS